MDCVPVAEDHRSTDERVMSAVADVATLCREMAECEAEDGCLLPPSCSRDLWKSLRNLVDHFQAAIALKDSESRLHWVVAQTPQLTSDVDGLQTDREALENMLRDILEMAEVGQSLTPIWARIERCFAEFTRNLVRHLARRRALSEFAFGGEFGIPPANWG